MSAMLAWGNCVWLPLVWRPHYLTMTTSYVVSECVITLTNRTSPKYYYPPTLLSITVLSCVTVPSSFLPLPLSLYPSLPPSPFPSLPPSPFPSLSLPLPPPSSLFTATCRCHTFGIGGEVCVELVTGIAAASGGRCVLLSPAERLQTKVGAC